jgi:hypothetical protein
MQIEKVVGGDVNKERVGPLNIKGGVPAKGGGVPLLRYRA